MAEEWPQPPCRAAKPRQGGRKDVKPLVLLDASRAEQDEFLRRDTVLPPDIDRARGGGEAVAPLEIDRVRNRADARPRNVQVLQHRRLQRPIGGDDPIGRTRTQAHGAPQRPVPESFEARPSRVGGAELLESLRVEDERRGRPSARRSRRRAYPRLLAPSPCTRSTSPRATRSAASRPARSPKSGYAVLRSITVVPRRPANGNVRYGTISTCAGRTRPPSMPAAWSDGVPTAASASACVGGRVMRMTDTPRRSR